MKKIVSAVLLSGLIAGPLLVSGRPARASSGKDILIGAAVVGVAYYVLKGHHHKSHKTAMAPTANSRFFAQNNNPLSPVSPTRSDSVVAN